MIKKKTTVLIKWIVRPAIDGARMKTPDRAYSSDKAENRCNVRLSVI